MARNPCNAVDAVMFAQRVRHDCEIIAKQLDVPVENIIGLAAEESEYGRGRIASEYNNYFSMHAPAPFQKGSEPAKAAPKVRVAVFDSFLESAQSFAAKYGSLVKGIADPKDFGAALVRGGFNSGSASTGGRDNFAQYLAGVIADVKARIACP
jgi:hypothetical protein